MQMLLRHNDKMMCSDIPEQGKAADGQGDNKSLICDRGLFQIYQRSERSGAIASLR